MRARRHVRWSVALAVLACVLGSTLVLAQPATPVVSPFPDPTARDFGPVAARDQYRFALLIPFPEDPFWQTVRAAMASRAAADGVAVDVVDLQTPSVPEQLAQIDDAIAKRYDGIILGPVDPAGVVPGVVAANAAGIPVLALDTAPLGGDVIAVVRTDGLAAARLAGTFIADAIGGEGTILDLQGDLANPVAQERERGLREAFTAFPKITVIAYQGNWSLASARSMTSAYLPHEGTPAAAGDEIDAVVAANDQMALGAAQAVDEAQADEVVVVGFGATTETLTAIRNGTLAATVAEFPSRAGAIAVDLMVRHLNGETVPSTVDSGSAIVTSDNIDDLPR
jgi:ribose transport system substrate-binding protein